MAKRKGNGGSGMQLVLGENVEEAIARMKELEKSRGILTSALQKCIRQGLVEKACWNALRLAEIDPEYAWRRLRVIVIEDVGLPEAINVVSTLYREAKYFGLSSRDGLRCIIKAAEILARSPKNRFADEFLELAKDVYDQWKEGKIQDEELDRIFAEWSEVPDETFDCHTYQGKQMGRGLEYWYTKSSETVNKVEYYEKWREWFKKLMMRLVIEDKLKE